MLSLQKNSEASLLLQWIRHQIKVWFYHGVYYKELIKLGWIAQYFEANHHGPLDWPCTVSRTRPLHSALEFSTTSVSLSSISCSGSAMIWSRRKVILSSKKSLQMPISNLLFFSLFSGLLCKAIAISKDDTWPVHQQQSS